jgi:hypothetical protein
LGWLLLGSAAGAARAPVAMNAASARYLEKCMLTGEDGAWRRQRCFGLSGLALMNEGTG